MRMMAMALALLVVSGCAIRTPGPPRAATIDVSDPLYGERHAESPSYGDSYEEREVRGTLVRQPLTTSYR